MHKYKYKCALKNHATVMLYASGDRQQKSFFFLQQINGEKHFKYIYKPDLKGIAKKDTL